MQVVLIQRFGLKVILIIFWTIFSLGCASTQNTNQKLIREALSYDDFKDNHFSGLLVVNPKTNDTLLNLNEQKYFTPASNVKIFTLYMGIKLLPKQLPLLKYLERNDTLFIQGVGNPTLLHPSFTDEKAIAFLKSHKHLAINLNNYTGDRYRPGWAWEDYDTYFSPELGPMPLYGNVVTVAQKDSVEITPNYFKPYTFRGATKKLRKERENLFLLPYTLDTLKIPYITGEEMSARLLSNELGTPVTLRDEFPEGNKEVLNGIATDSVLREMMYESDNFLAEQLALVSSSILSDTLGFEKARKHLLDTYLTDIKQPPRWVDGSGLSRYNLFTPESMVQVLSKLYAEVSRERLFHLFPYWDENGTVDKSDESEEQHYMVAKSGSLGNNYNLSGYLITKSDNVLIFSFMNNHFRNPSSEIRQHIKNLLQQLHENY